MFENIRDFFNDTIHNRGIKSCILALYWPFNVLTIITAFVAFFVGDYYNPEFPKVLFWFIVIVLAVIAFCIRYSFLLQTKYADPRMMRCIYTDENSIHYIFKNKSELPEKTIIRILRRQKGVATPYALAYIDCQDYINPSIMQVKPIAFYEGDRLVVKDAPIISDKKAKNYYICADPISKEVLDQFVSMAKCMELYSGGEHSA